MQFDYYFDDANEAYKPSIIIYFYSPHRSLYISIEFFIKLNKIKELSDNKLLLGLTIIKFNS